LATLRGIVSSAIDSRLPTIARPFLEQYLKVYQTCDPYASAARGFA
jgi:hypothetical protein